MNEVTILACTRRASEGKTVEVDYRGNVDDTMLDVLGGLRSDILFSKACLQHSQSSSPVCGSRKSQASSVGQTAQSLTCSIMEKPHTVLITV